MRETLLDIRARKVRVQMTEEQLTEAKAGKILDAVYKKALDGVPKISRSVDELAD